MLYLYRCVVEAVVDADTLDVAIDLGFSVTVHERIRIANINAVEKSTAKGKLAIAFVQGWLKDRTVAISTYKNKQNKDRQEKFGRYLGVITDAVTGETLSSQLLKEGYAVPFMVIK